MELNERIKKARKMQGYKSRDALAEALGSTRDAIASYELGRVVPNDVFLQLMAAKLNLSYEWLKEGKGEMEAKPSSIDAIIEKLDADPSGNHDIPSIRVGIFGSETFSDEMRRRIEERLHIECFDIYGMTETGGVGTTGQDCKCHCGLHVFEDQYITEVIDPATGKLVPDGEYGEIVFTSLTREAMPIIRYRTHDITRILSREKCECGRTSLRIDRITGRTDDMLIVKGVNFYPRQVEQALKEIPGIADEFQIILEERHGMTDVTINVEAEPGVTGHTVAKHLRERLGFLPKGDVFPIGALPRNEGKAKRVIKKVLD